MCACSRQLKGLADVLVIPQVHLRSAERLRELCCANRGTFIKVGQHLGALDYLLPEEYTRTLKVLHSQAPQSSRQEIEQVIREDLGKEVRAANSLLPTWASASPGQLKEAQEVLGGSEVPEIPRGDLCFSPPLSWENTMLIFPAH